MDKFKVGDRVKDKTFGYGTIVESNNYIEDELNLLVKFDKCKEGLHDGNRLSKKKYKKNTCYWYSLSFANTRLKLIRRNYTYEDLKKSPIGTKVTFESGIILIKVDKENYKEIKEYGTTRYIELLKGLKDNWQFMNQGKIIKIEEPTYKTVYEHKEEILDETEKRYLKGIIRPFKEKVTYISKLHTREDKEFISINLKNGDYIDLPLFKENTMYKKMIINKDYTLKELGL